MFQDWMIPRSFLLENWKFTIPITVICILILRIIKRLLKKKRKTKNTPTINHLSALSESEYIGEYVNDTNIDTDELKPSLKEIEHIPFSGATHFLTGGIDEFYKIANDRRSVRKFSKKPVNYEIIKKCILAAGTSPSGAHTEPWTFCVIENHQLKEQIRTIIESEETLNYAQRMAKQWTTDLQPLKTNAFKEYLTDAPYLILVFKQIYGLCANGQKKQHYYNEISTSIATGILLSALQCAGLNSLTTTPLNCGPALRTLLDRPENEKLLVLIPVGYAADDCTVPGLKRKSIDEILVKY